MNNVTLIGRLGNDVTLRFVPGSGQAVANFTLCVDKGLTREKKQQFEAEGKPTADFIRIVVWNKPAENCSQYLSKGKMVAIQGSIQTSSYKGTTGETVYVTEVLANRVEFLEFGKTEKKDESQKEGNDFSFGAGAQDFKNVEDDDDVPW